MRPPDEAVVGAPIVGHDGLARCPWAAGTPLLTDYHDTEWGVPVHGEQLLYERLVLEGFQSGLSWLTILRKRPAFRAAFADFDPDAVAAFTDVHLDAVMQNPAIVRNRSKVEAARTNARAVIALRGHGGLDHFLWSRRPVTAPAAHLASDIPTQSPESADLAKALRGSGFRFIGPTTAYALMEATGMIDGHLVGCHRRA